MTSVTVDVPVLNNLFNNKNVAVGLQIDTPTGSAVLQPGGTTGPADAILTIIDVNPDLVGPTVTDLRLVGHVNDITTIAIDTSGHLDPATASNPANFTITALGGIGKAGLPLGTVVPVSQVLYDPTTGSIYLTPSRPLPGGELFIVVVNGSRPGAVTDLAGNPLNSAVGSAPGSDYVLTIARGTTITYHDNNDVAVTLKLTGPGTLDLDRYVDGEVQKLQVVGGVAHKTVVTGTGQAAGATLDHRRDRRPGPIRHDPIEADHAAVLRDESALSEPPDAGGAGDDGRPAADAAPAAEAPQARPDAEDR